MVDYDALGVKPHVEAAARELAPRFGITSIGGYRASATDPNGHPAGLALDMMCNRLQGDALSAYARANAKRLSISYIIWRQRIWSDARSGEGWRAMEDRGSPTANHFDHVHLNFNATAGTNGPVVDPVGNIPNPLDAVDAAGDFFGFVLDRDMWIRLAMWTAGGILILIGLFMLAKNANSPKQAAVAAAQTARKAIK